MRLIGTVSLGAFVFVAYLAASHFDHAAAATSIAVVTKPSTGGSLMTEVKCVKVDGELKCGKKKHHSDDDDDHHGKDKDNGTKTVKLIKLQDTCHVFTPGMGGGGCATPLIRRCDKLKDGDQVCCCYKVDNSQPAQ